MTGAFSSCHSSEQAHRVVRAGAHIAGLSHKYCNQPHLLIPWINLEPQISTERMHAFFQKGLDKILNRRNLAVQPYVSHDQACINAWAAIKCLILSCYAQVEKVL